MTRDTGRLDAIDGLRALAMTAVVAQHCKLAPPGWTGVWLFYVISGFVIARTFLLPSDLKPPRAYRAFIRRRFFRIVPAYLMYIAINLLVMAATGHTVGFRDVPFLLSFSYNWQMIFQLWPTPDGWSAFGHLWTLSVEEQFYLVFPLMLLFLPRLRFRLIAFALVLAGPVIRFGFARTVSAIAPDPGWLAFAVYAASFTQFDAFLMGALLALFEPEVRRAPAAWRRFALAALACALTYGLFYGVVNFSAGATGLGLARNLFSGVLYGQGRELFVYTVVDLLAVSIVGLVLVDPRLSRALSHPILRFVGRVSYGAYLYHALVLSIFGSFLMPAGFDALPVAWRLPWFLLAWTVTVGIAALSFRRFELPLIRWAGDGFRPGRLTQAGSRPLAPLARPAHEAVEEINSR